MATQSSNVVSTSPSKYAGKEIKTLASGAKVRVDTGSSRSGSGSKHAIDINNLGKDAPLSVGPQATPIKDTLAMLKPKLPSDPASIDTTQPSPGAIKIDPNAEAPAALTEQVNQATQQVSDIAKNRGASMSGGGGSAFSLPDVNAQMRQGFDQVSTSGIPAPQTYGAGSAVAGAVTTPPPASPSVVGNIMETDQNFDSILTSYDDFFSPTKQRESLLKEYKKFEKSLGIQGMNEELIDAKRIIEGTEDDIRNEVTATGGFATDSQVQALANARNKSLIKNYNYLLESRDNAMTQLNTMMNLSIEDRKFAEAEFDRKLNFAFKTAEFQQRATDNARSQYTRMLESGMGASLLGDPYQEKLIEKTLGLAPGGLRTMIAQKQKDIDLDRRYRQAQIDNIYSEISDRANVNNVNMGLNVPATPDGIKSVVQQFTQSKDIPAAMRTQMGKALTVMQKAEDMATSYEGKFPGNVLTGTLGKIASVLLPGGRKTEGQATLERDIGKLRQDIVNYITGAAYTTLQERDVDSMIPSMYATDAENQRRLDDLYNTLVGDTQAGLLANGFNVELPRVETLKPSNVVQPKPGDIIEID